MHEAATGAGVVAEGATALGVFRPRVRIGVRGGSISPACGVRRAEEGPRKADDEEADADTDAGAVVVVDDVVAVGRVGVRSPPGVPREAGAPRTARLAGGEPKEEGAAEAAVAGREATTVVAAVV